MNKEHRTGKELPKRAKVTEKTVKREQVRTEFTNWPSRVTTKKTTARTSLDRHENKGKNMKTTTKTTTTIYNKNNITKIKHHQKEQQQQH